MPSGNVLSERNHVMLSIYYQGIANIIHSPTTTSITITNIPTRNYVGYCYIFMNKTYLVGRLKFSYKLNVW